MTGKTKTFDRCLPPEPHVLADAVPEALKQFLRPVTATQEAVLGAAVEKEEAMPPGLLAFAADALGEVRDRSLAVPVLLELVGGGQPDVVREAAIVALSGDLGDPRVANALRTLADDESVLPYLRAMAADRLDDV